MLLKWVLVIAAFVFPGQSGAEEFDYIDRHANTVTTTHGPAFRIKIGVSFQPLGELHHHQESNGRMFRVSFTAFSNETDIILIRAETLEIASGVLNYDHLPQRVINGISVGLREQCIPVEAETSLSDNPEAQFVTERGFALQLPFLLTQHLMASDDGNAEVVFSYGQTIEYCAEISNTLRTDTQTRIANVIKLERISD